MTTPDHTLPRTSSNALYNANKLKLGLFGINCDDGCTMTLVDEALDVSWEKTREIAQFADRLGFEALVPIARWLGLGQHEVNGRSFDPYTWAAGLAQVTEQITLVTTSHVQSMHPVTAAKAVSTIDHISGGRSTLNVVTGWFPAEFKMFGIEFLEHDRRYAYAAEWIEVVTRLWTDPEPDEKRREYINNDGGYSKPKPLQQPHPPIMNAGGSTAGRAFIADTCDIGYLAIADHDDLDKTRREVESMKERARSQGREVQLWTYAYVIQRDTQEEADRYLDRIAHELGDDDAAETFASNIGVNSQIMSAEAWQGFKTHLKAGHGGYALVGTAEQIAERLAGLAEIGLDGVALSWVDFVDGLERFSADVLPLLEASGLRAPVAVGAGR
jgi:alkanesulfonate monooxygenase SsuD/methylene tetrahydromethanopterin reductase-like flavin-dependent oxidoreductase (luciferase family)